MRRFIPILLLGIGAWVALHRYRQQYRLHQQLEQFTRVLAVENDRVATEAQNTIKGIEAAVAKNRNQPADIALLQRAEALQASVDKLLTTLRNYGSPLHHATRAVPAAGQVPGHGTLRWQGLQKQVAAYADTLRQLGLAPADAAPLAAPDFLPATPAVEARAACRQLESEVLTRQTFALQHLVQSLDARRWLTLPLVTANAESNVVAPGDIYRAQLGLVGYYSANELKMQMACNGHPVPAGPDGTGLVRFRAPTRPGPATWVGTLRINQNGRDTTFKVTVPYRVARR